MLPRGVLSYFHIYLGSDHFFGVQNFEFQYFWGFSEKKIFFFFGGGVSKFCGYFLGSSQSWTYFRCHFFAFKRLFIRSR